MNKKVVAYKNLPTKFPLVPSIVLWLFMDRIHAPAWAWGAVWMFVGLLWVSYFWQMTLQKSVDLFETKEHARILE
jgi:hypothetical protein